MTWKNDALKHAKEADPKEACGVVVVVKGKEKYWPCKNLATRAEDQFILDPLDYAEAEDTGEVVAIVHSHPVTSPIPSEADKVACEKTGLKWYIIQPNLQVWFLFEPCGYKAPLIGRQWVWGVNDCWSLCRDYYQQELGIELIDWDRPNDPDEFIKNPTFNACFEATGFRELEPDEELEKGDLLLMSIHSLGLNHIGVFLGENVVLHHLEKRLSSRDLLDEWLLKCIGRRIRYVA